MFIAGKISNPSNDYIDAYLTHDQYCDLDPFGEEINSGDFIIVMSQGDLSANFNRGPYSWGASCLVIRCNDIWSTCKYSVSIEYLFACPATRDSQHQYRCVDGTFCGGNDCCALREGFEELAKCPAGHVMCNGFCNYSLHGLNSPPMHCCDSGLDRCKAMNGVLTSCPASAEATAVTWIPTRVSSERKLSGYQPHSECSSADPTGVYGAPGAALQELKIRIQCAIQ